MESKKERIHIKTLILANEVKTLGYWKEKEEEDQSDVTLGVGRGVGMQVGTGLGTEVGCGEGRGDGK